MIEYNTLQYNTREVDIGTPHLTRMVLRCSSACHDFPNPMEGIVFYDSVQAALQRDAITAWDSYALSMSEKNFVEVSVQTLRN